MNLSKANNELENKMINVSITLVTLEEQRKASSGLFLGYQDEYRAEVTDGRGERIMSPVMAGSKAELLNFVVARLNSEAEEVRLEGLGEACI